MGEQNARRKRRRLAVAFAAAAAIAIAAAASALGRHGPPRPASPAEVAAALPAGIPWIWPDSNGPLALPPGQQGHQAALARREAAVLVESLVLRGRGVERGGRRQPLPLPADVRIVPVVHVESGPDAPVEFTPAQRDAVLAAVRRHAGLAAGGGGAGLLQLDFEAPTRQREAYRALVGDVRAALPAGVRLSVTALAHWCTQGDWLDQLPVDEVVPMLYRLGPHADRWRSRFEQATPGPQSSGDEAGGLARRCRGPALGFATNDPPSPALVARTARAYWFDEDAWSNPSAPPRHLATSFSTPPP